MDIFIPRGAWLAHPMRPTLLRNNGDGTFTDVTREAKLLDPVNSNSASWADYDNDGFARPVHLLRAAANRLYHNRGDGTFEEVAVRAGLLLPDQPFCKGAAWIDYDNDRYPDLFLNNLNGGRTTLFRNNRDGTFIDVTADDGDRRARGRASRAGRGTTTTTAGSTFSPPATTDRSRTWSRA